jgi:hypothetical protein
MLQAALDTNMSVSLPSSDPRVFGPPLWTGLHIIALNYPDTASERTQKTCRRFLFGLSRLLPCPACGKHFRSYLRQHDLKRAVRGRDSLVRLLVDAHNEVSKHTRPSCPPFSVEDAGNCYTRMCPPHASPLAQVWLSPSRDRSAP